jgi:hypothetical protein
MQNSTIKGIQMIGTQRSGSNLLRLMLNQLPEVFAPHPPHVFVVFFPLLPYYGNLEDDTNFKNLLNDVCTLIELNPVPWSEVDLNRETLFNMCANRSLLEIFVKINELQCMEKGKTTWCCKSLETVYFIQNFKREHFSPFVIYLVRDGRDVAVSFKKAIIGEKHIYHLAQKWKKDQELALSYIEQTPKDKYTILKYEDFILEPEKHIKNICDLTGMHYAPDVMDYYVSEESKKTADSGKMWENVAKPVMKDNTKKYKAALSETELNIFEAVAGNILDKFGYEREIKNPQNGYAPDEIKAFDAENDRLKKEALQNASEKDREKRKPQKDFIESLTRKLNKG